MKRKLFYVIALLCIATSLNAQTLTWKNYRLRLHQLTADTIAVTDAYVQYLTVDTVIVQKYYYQQEIGIVDSSTYWVSSTNDTLKLSMDQLKLYAIELEDDNVRVASLDTLGYAYFKRVGINVDPTKRLSISDGTDTFHQDVTSDKWTLFNDAGTPLAIITADSVGNLIIVGDLAVNGGDITTTGDLTITPAGDDVLLDAGLTVGSTTQAGDNNLRVEGTSALVGNVTCSGDIAVNGGDITSSGALTVTPGAGTNLNVILSTTGDFAVNTDDLYVDTSSGYAGIGTTGPNSKLHVYSLADATSAGNGQLRVGGDQNTLGNKYLSLGVNQTSNYVFVQGTNAGIGYVSLGLQIDGGNVGIGTTAPSAKLDVFGSLRISKSSGGGCYTNISHETGDMIIDLYGVNTQLGIQVGGSIKFWMANDGKVGLGGTTGPASTLSINGNLGIGATYATIAAPSDGVIIEGRAGFGTTVPQAQLSQVSATPGWYMTDRDLNIIRTSLAQATDTAAVYIEADGTPSLTFAGTDGDVYSLTINTSDQAVFSGASGVSLGTDALLMSTNTANYILRSDGTDYSPVKFDDSADLAGFMDDETGTGLAVFGTSPTITTPTFSGIVTGAAALRGTNSFTTTATADTIVISGVSASSIFVVSINDATPVANDLLGWTATTDTLFVHRVAGTTSGLAYSYIRIN
uniref:Uncharacterized protein n=1 Tax=viral metagenome TaxID=1070528 RepID=A0A6H1ZG04_9ZZZZ